MSSGNNFGLSDTELKIALCALKVTLIDGKVRVHPPAPRVMDAQPHVVFSANVLTIPGRERPSCQTDRSQQCRLGLPGLVHGQEEAHGDQRLPFGICDLRR